MPILYGEGAEVTFFRLQSQIFNASPDHTLLAWQRVENNESHDLGLFAGSPDAFTISRFLDSRSYEELGLASHTHSGSQPVATQPTTYSAFSHGMGIQLLIRYLRKDAEGQKVYAACIACRLARRRSSFRH